MRTKSASCAAVVALFLATSSRAQAQAAPSQEMQFARFFVGTWNCAHTVGDFSGTYTTTISNSLGNRWLKQTYDFPTLGDGVGPVNAEYFIGYDPRVQSWLRFGAMSDGQYFAMRGTRSGNTWSWNYVLPGTSGNAAYTKQSDSEFTVDGPSYPQNGKSVTEHHTCKKSS
jgi:hypothetical protein